MNTTITPGGHRVTAEWFGGRLSVANLFAADGTFLATTRDPDVLARWLTTL